MNVRTLSRLAILVAVVALPVGAALASYALSNDVEPVVPAEIHVGGTDPIPVGEHVVRTRGTTTEQARIRPSGPGNVTPAGISD